jgi:RES domain-containing protein
VDLPLAHLAQSNTIRLVSSGRLKKPVLLALAPTQGALEDLVALESVTNTRMRAQQGGLGELDASELVFGRHGFSFINAAFTHTRTGGDRFNSSERGAWYCAFEGETAIAEVAYHLTQELAAIDRFENTTDYAELFADFIGPFHDFRDADPAAERCLSRDPTIGYPAGQALARDLRANSRSNGIVYPSIRRNGGTCLVAFHPSLVQNVRQGGLWRLEWQGSPSPEVSRVTQ